MAVSFNDRKACHQNGLSAVLFNLIYIIKQVFPEAAVCDFWLPIWQNHSIIRSKHDENKVGFCVQHIPFKPFSCILGRFSSNSCIMNERLSIVYRESGFDQVYPFICILIISDGPVCSARVAVAKGYNGISI